MSGSEPEPSSERERQLSGRNTGETVTLGDRLQRKSTLDYIKFNAGIFLTMSLGYGLTVFLVASLSGQGMNDAGIIAGSAFVLGILLAPLTAVVTGIVTGREIDDDAVSAALAGGVGGGVGFVIMFVVLLLFLALTTGNGGSAGGDTGVGVLFGLIIGVGATGAMTAYVANRTRDSIHSRSD